MSSLQAPQLLWPALKEAGQTAQAFVPRATVNPVWEDFTATLPASLNPQDPAEGGNPDSQETNIMCYYLNSQISAYQLCFKVVLLFLMQILLCGGSHHTHSYWWNYRGTMSRGFLLLRGSCSTSALWSRDICRCDTRYSVRTLCARLVLCVRLSVLVSCRSVVYYFVYP